MQFKTYGAVDEKDAAPFYRNFPAMDPAKAAPTAIGQGLYDAVAGVNKKVNGAIQYDANDRGDWSGPRKAETAGIFGPKKTTLSGSCRDYVITKMLELHGMGVPRGAMRMATAWVNEPNGARTPHVVLLVTQDDGRAWVLDNRTNDVYDWPGLPNYEWGQAELPGEPNRRWGRLTPQGGIGLDAWIGSTASGVPGDGS